jgi:type II secretory pathway pseudopilin PulG
LNAFDIDGPRGARLTRIFRDPAGMTLVEVLIAIGVLVVGLLALLATMPLSTSGVAESSRKTTATFLAQQRLEQVKNVQWCLSCGAAGAAVDTLGGGGSDGNAAVGQWPDEGYGTVTFPGAANCAANDRSGRCQFRRQVRIVDCSVVSCSGVAVGLKPAKTLRQVTVTVFFLGMTGSGSASATEENVQMVTLIARRS